MRFSGRALLPRRPRRPHDLGPFGFSRWFTSGARQPRATEILPDRTLANRRPTPAPAPYADERPRDPADSLKECGPSNEHERSDKTCPSGAPQKSSTPCGGPRISPRRESDLTTNVRSINFPATGALSSSSRDPLGVGFRRSSEQRVRRSSPSPGRLPFDSAPPRVGFREERAPRSPQAGPQS